MKSSEQKKIGFFDQIIYSVQPNKYKELLKQPGKAVVFYIILLGLCLCVMDYVIPIAGYMTSFGGVDHLITKVLPKIEFSQGQLQADSKIEIGKESTVHILVDTSLEKVEIDSVQKDKYISEILIGQKNMIIYSSYMGTAEMEFAQYKDAYFNNESLLRLKPWIYAMLISNFFTALFAELFRYLISALPLAVVGWLMGGPDRTGRLSFFKIYMLALYAKTAVALFVSFNNAAGLLKSQVLILYVGLMFTMFLLMTGIRKAEERVG